MSVRTASVLYLLDVEPEADEHHRYGKQAKPETNAPVVALDHGIVTRFAICCGNLHSGLNILLDEIGLIAVNRDSCLGQSILGLVLVKPRFTHFHAGGFGGAERIVCSFDGLIELGKAGENGATGTIAVITLSVALHADAAGSCVKHRVRRHMNAVIVMTDYAAGQPLLLKCLAMRALLIHLRLKDVAVCADVLHLVHTRRNRTMIAVTGGARRGGKVTANSESVVMDAGVVFDELVGRDAVRLHICGIRMAARAGSGHVDRVHS